MKHERVPDTTKRFDGITSTTWHCSCGAEGHFAATDVEIEQFRGDLVTDRMSGMYAEHIEQEAPLQPFFDLPEADRESLLDDLRRHSSAMLHTKSTAQDFGLWQTAGEVARKRKALDVLIDILSKEPA